MSDVPANSPRTAAHNFFVRLYRYPDRKAPIIEPGKARSDPEPMVFLITDVVKAAETPCAGAGKHGSLPKERKRPVKEGRLPQ